MYLRQVSKLFCVFRNVRAYKKFEHTKKPSLRVGTNLSVGSNSRLCEFSSLIQSCLTSIL
jgi:hypothetical protein